MQTQGSCARFYKHWYGSCSNSCSAAQQQQKSNSAFQSLRLACRFCRLGLGLGLASGPGGQDRGIKKPLVHLPPSARPSFLPSFQLPPALIPCILLPSFRWGRDHGTWKPQNKKGPNIISLFDQETIDMVQIFAELEPTFHPCNLT